MRLLGFPRTVASFLLEQLCIFVFFNWVSWIFARLDEKLHGEGGQIVFHKGYSSFSHLFFLPKVVDNLSSNARDNYLFLLGQFHTFLFRVASIVCCKFFRLSSQIWIRMQTEKIHLWSSSGWPITDAMIDLHGYHPDPPPVDALRAKHTIAPPSTLK